MSDQLMTIFLACIACLLLPILYFLPTILDLIFDIRRCRKISKALEDLPCPVKEKHWLFGSMKNHPGPSQKMLDMLIDWTTKFPRYYALDYGSISRYVVFNHPETVKMLLTTDEPKIMCSYGWTYCSFKPWLGEGLGISNGEKWYRNRRLLTPAFHFDILHKYLHLMNTCTDEYMQHLAKVSAFGKPVNSFESIQLFTFSVILNCAYGFEGNVYGNKKEDLELVDGVKFLFEGFNKRLMNPMHSSDVVYFNSSDGKAYQKACKFLHDYVRKLLNERRKNIHLTEEKLNQNKKLDFLDCLIMARSEDGDTLSDQDIIDQMATFLAAAIETSKTGLGFFFYNMATHKSYQAKVRKEIDGLLVDRETDDLLYKDLTHLPYTTQCIKESLRIYPPVAMIGRELTKPMKLDEHVLPVGTPVEINIWNLHHNPEVWGDDHMTYDPERFNDANVEKMDPFAFVPFSAGPRNCLGQNFAMNEMKVLIVKLLHKFEVSTDDSYKLELNPSFTLTTERDIPLYLTPV